MTHQIEHDKLVEHARKLDEECRTWTERQLRSTYFLRAIVEQSSDLR
jgi:hypothetical protein